MRVLFEHPITQRQFADWTTGYRTFRVRAVAPQGFRDSFDDLESWTGPSTAARALAELTLWFRVRSGAVAASR